MITLDKGNGNLLKCKSKGTAFIGERRAVDEKRNSFIGIMKDLWDENTGDVSLVLSRLTDQASRQERKTLTCSGYNYKGSYQKQRVLKKRLATF